MAKKAEIRGGTSDIAKLLMITQRRVNQLADEGIITRQIEGDFILPEAIAEYYGYKYQTEESFGFMHEKSLHEAAKRKITELELAKKESRVHDAADVELVMTDMLANIRSQLLGIPAKMAPLLANRDKGYISRELGAEIVSRLTELSDYKPEMFSGGDDDEK